MKKMISLVLVAAAICVAASAAEAVPITGDIGFAGTLTTTGDPGGPSILDGATGLDFALAFVLTGTGTYAVVPALTVAAFTDFTFNPFVGPISPLWTFTIGPTTYSFDLSSLSIDTQSATNLDLSGTGTLKVTGLDDTPGTWAFSTQDADGLSGPGAVFTFSADNVAEAVAEPASLLLLGTGLVGAAAVARRRRRQNKA